MILCRVFQPGNIDEKRLLQAIGGPDALPAFLPISRMEGLVVKTVWNDRDLLSGHPVQFDEVRLGRGARGHDRINPGKPFWHEVPVVESSKEAVFPLHSHRSEIMHGYHRAAGQASGESADRGHMHDLKTEIRRRSTESATMPENILEGFQHPPDARSRARRLGALAAREHATAELQNAGLHTRATLKNTQLLRYVIPDSRASSIPNGSAVTDFQLLY